MSIKNYMTPSGIEPATFRFVAQYFDHSGTAVPRKQLRNKLKKKEMMEKEREYKMKEKKSMAVQ
jgi:hypothetical protein